PAVTTEQPKPEMTGLVAREAGERQPEIPTAKPEKPAVALDEWDPMPIFRLPKGAYVDRDEHTRLLELYYDALHSKTEPKRVAAKSQLERTLTMADSGRSLLALFLLRKIEWMVRHPEAKPKLVAKRDQSQADYDYFAFALPVRSFDTTPQHGQESTNGRALQGGIWEGLPAC